VRASWAAGEGAWRGQGRERARDGGCGATPRFLSSRDDAVDQIPLMLHLPDEILERILLDAFRDIDASDPTACALSLVSHRVRAVSWPLRWRSVALRTSRAAYLLAAYLERNPAFTVPVRHLLVFAFGRVPASLCSLPVQAQVPVAEVAPTTRSTTARSSRFSRRLLSCIRRKNSAPSTDAAGTRPPFSDSRAAMVWATARVLSAFAPTLRYVGWIADENQLYALLPVQLPLLEEMALCIRHQHSAFHRWTHHPSSDEVWPNLRRLHLSVSMADDNQYDAVHMRLRALHTLAPALTHLRLSCLRLRDIERMAVFAGQERLLPTTLRRITLQPVPDAWHPLVVWAPEHDRNCHRMPLGSIKDLPLKIRTYLQEWDGSFAAKIALVDWVGGPDALESRYPRAGMVQGGRVIAEDFEERYAHASVDWDEGDLVLGFEFDALLTSVGNAAWDAYKAFDVVCV
jgi:hypothetical protein